MENLYYISSLKDLDEVPTYAKKKQKIECHQNKRIEFENMLFTNVKLQHTSFVLSV
jgi:hypothetical protein